MTHDEMIAVIAADRDGKKVQCWSKRSADTYPWTSFSSEPSDRPVWNFEDFNYRVAPEPVPPGDLTWEEAKRLHESGVKVEYLCPWHTRPAWSTVVAWFDNATEGEIKSSAYRRKPAPRMVPLCFPADVKPGDWFRYTDGKGSSHVQGGWVHCASVTVICDSAIRIEGMGWFNPEAAQEQLEVTRDSGATWHRCEKPAKEEA